MECTIARNNRKVFIHFFSGVRAPDLRFDEAKFDFPIFRFPLILVFGDDGIGVWSKKGRKRVGKRGRNEGGEMKRKETERELRILMDIETGLDCTVTKIS